VGLLLALLSAGILLRTTSSLGAMGPFKGQFIIQICVLGLMGALLVQISHHHSLAHRFPDTLLSAVQVPVWLKLSTIGSLIGLLSIVVVSIRTYGEGSANLLDGHYVWIREGMPNREITAADYQASIVDGLQVFASSWLFFSLAATWAGHVVTGRIKQFRSARPAA